MKYLLIIAICSTLDSTCITPMEEPYIYPKIYDTHAECVKYGLGESFDILYGWNIKEEMINEYGLYPKFTCEKTGSSI